MGPIRIIPLSGGMPAVSSCEGSDSAGLEFLFPPSGLTNRIPVCFFWKSLPGMKAASTLYACLADRSGRKR